ncbi:MAG TPA: glycoside hydrolase family 16 protein [Acidimicrobiia bacterium]
MATVTAASGSGATVNASERSHRATGRRRRVARRRSLAVEVAGLVLVVLVAACIPARTISPDWPSGAPMPVGDVPGWHQVFRDDFLGSSLNQHAWGAYEGQPAGDPGGWWDPSHVVVRGGTVQLATYRDPRFGRRWVSGGMSSAHALRQTYGKYLVRFRVDAGDGVALVLLLWPAADMWPPEIDFGESGGGSRQEMSATLHYGTTDHQIQRSVSADFTRWHTMGVEWTPGRLQYTLDGRVWATIDSPAVPAIPMEMDAQAQAGTCGDRWAPCPDATTPGRVDAEIDWVVAYRRG